MRYIIEIYNFDDKKVVEASWVEIGVVLRLLEVYKACPRIKIKGYDAVTKGNRNERNEIL